MYVCMSCFMYEYPISYQLKQKVIQNNILVTKIGMLHSSGTIGSHQHNDHEITLYIDKGHQVEDIPSEL